MTDNKSTSKKSPSPKNVVKKSPVKKSSTKAATQKNRPVKKTTTKKSTAAAKKVPTPKNQINKFSLILSWCFRTGLKLVFILLMFLVIYCIYLDAKLTKAFEGQRWQVPVQIFAQVPIYHEGDTLKLSNLRLMLEQMQYKKVARVFEAGQFSLSEDRIIIFRRQFNFGQGLEPAIKLTIDVEHNHITRVYREKHQVSRIRLEPLFLDRLLPENKEDRVLVTIEQVPEALIDTLVLVEDRDFYQHAGVSPLAITRALFKNIMAGRTVQGGSTLTQQLVKNMFLTREKTLLRKAKEALMSLVLELRYSKDELLEAYINEVYLGQHYGNGVYGFGLAAKFYFGKNLNELNNQQIALLVAQVKGPSYYDPWRHPERAKERRDLVLRLMFEDNALSVNEFQYSVQAPLSVKKSKRLIEKNYPAYMQKVKEELSLHLAKADQQNGVRVFTGFSVIAQNNAERALKEQLAKLDKSGALTPEDKLQAAMIVTDHTTGEVQAIVGGRDSNYGFNRALDAVRPIGSLVKPVVYLTALEQDQKYNLATVLKDEKITLTNGTGKNWQPKNYDGKYRGQVNLIDGLVKSLNIPTVNLGMELGLANVVNTMVKLGADKKLARRPSLLLGAVNMSPWQVNQMYIAIAGQGYYRNVHAISKIISTSGDVLYQYDDIIDKRINTSASYLLDYALMQVAKTGTAKSLTWRIKGKGVAGKTGTTNAQRDSWFVGYDDKLLITTWLGHDNNSATHLTGSSGALVLFADFINKQGLTSKALLMPEQVTQQGFEVQSGHAVGENCENVIKLPVAKQGLRIKECLQENKKSSWFNGWFG